MRQRSGISISVDDLVIPKRKSEIIEQAEEEVKKIQAQFSSGLVTQGERYSKVSISGHVPTIMVAQAMMESFPLSKLKIRKATKLSRNRSTQFI